MQETCWLTFTCSLCSWALQGLNHGMTCRYSTSKSISISVCVNQWNDSCLHQLYPFTQSEEENLTFNHWTIRLEWLMGIQSSCLSMVVSCESVFDFKYSLICVKTICSLHKAVYSRTVLWWLQITRFFCGQFSNHLRQCTACPLCQLLCSTRCGCFYR